MDALRDALNNAFDEHNDDAAQHVETAATTIEPSDDEAEEVYIEPSFRERDERGRFARKAQAEDDAIPQDDQKAIDGVSETSNSEQFNDEIAKPASWKKDYENDWATLPRRVQEYINQRESQFASGVSQYKTQLDSVRPIADAIQSFLPDLQQHNIDPSQWISSLGTAHKLLATGTPEQKLNAFAKLATDYGVPLGAITGSGVDPQAQYMTQQLQEMRQEWQSIKAAQQQEQEMRIHQEIERAAQDAPLFDDAREIMAQLFEAGLVKDLNEAYQKAIRLDDALWQKHQALQAQKTAKEQAQKIAEKKAKAVSVKSDRSPTATGGQKTLRGALYEAFDSLGAGD